MKIENIKIHNIRSILDAEFDLKSYSLLVGENNSGKSNLIHALRLFYEDRGIKFDYDKDFPKIDTSDNESWIEIKFRTTDDEQENLRDKYKDHNNLLRVRKYFHSEENSDLVKKNQSNIYAFEGDELSTNLFYGAKNISEAKLGRVIYIPELSKPEDNLKLSGPSPLREMVNFVFKKIIDKSDSYQELKSAFNSFNKSFQNESSSEGYSLTSLQEDINANLDEWDISFGLKINPIEPQDIIKNLVSHYVQDENLNQKEVDFDSLGQGIQRHVIFTLIKLSTNYQEIKTSQKKEFAPDFTLLLYEEPEAFLHPSQQEQLNLSLQKLVNQENQQVLLTTHSPVFVNKNTHDLPSLIKLRKEEGVTKTYQIPANEVSSLFDKNTGMYKYFSDLLSDGIDEQIKQKIRSKGLGHDNPDLNNKLEEEEFQYFLWMDSERSASFFARNVILCEGPSEKYFLDFLINTEWSDLKNKQIYFLDASGKFNFHRYMNLFGNLGIKHSILIDKDNDENVHFYVNQFLDQNKNKFTVGFHEFNPDLEGFLNIDAPNNKRLKPLNVLKKYQNSEITGEKVQELREVVMSLIQ